MLLRTLSNTCRSEQKRKIELSKAFDAVLNNDIIKNTSDIGYWDIENGSEEYYEDNNGNRYTYDETEEAEEQIEEIREDIEALEDAHYEEIFQYFIISDNGAEILKDYTDEIVFYNEALDMYVWGVTHWGTSWDYVLTDIKLNCGEEAFN